MLITWVSFKAPFDKPKVMENLRTWIKKKFCKAVGWVLVSVFNVFHPCAVLCLKCLVLEHTAYPAKHAAQIVWSFYSSNTAPKEDLQ